MSAGADIQLQLHGTLALPGAMAVLLPLRSDDRHERDAIASAALRRATGRADITIARRPTGRPRLEPPYPELGVSIARRGGLAVVGFSASAEVGVDIEAIGSASPLDPRRLASDHFAAAEAAAIASLAPDAARSAFLMLWVAKEAALKTTGRGVFDGLDQPDLSASLDRLLGGDVVRVAPSAALPSGLMVRAASLQDDGASGSGIATGMCWALARAGN